MAIQSFRCHDNFFHLCLDKGDIIGKTLGTIKIWSPNGLNNPNSGGTLFKIGKTLRLDFEAGKQLFHTHITCNLYNSMPNFMKSMKCIFDPAKRDVHVRLTSILGGVIGVTQKE